MVLSHAGLAADNPLGNAELYSIIDILEILWNKFAEVFFEKDPQKKVKIISIILLMYYYYSRV